MTFLRRGRMNVAVIALGASLSASACSSNDSSQPNTDDQDAQQDQDQDQGEQDPIPEPEYDSDDTVRLPLGMVSPAGHNEIAPLDDDGQIDPADEHQGTAPHQIEIARSEVFGCEDTISVIQSVPIATEDPGQAAVEYLLNLDTRTHGDLAFENSLAEFDDLSVESVELEGSEVTVTLDGDLAAADSCENWRVAKQVEATSRMATGAESAELLLDDAPLWEQLGLEDDSDLDITEIQSD